MTERAAELRAQHGGAKAEARLVALVRRAVETVAPGAGPGA